MSPHGNATAKEETSPFQFLRSSSVPHNEDASSSDVAVPSPPVVSSLQADSIRQSSGNDVESIGIFESSSTREQNNTPITPDVCDRSLGILESEFPRGTITATRSAIPALY